MLWWDLLHLKSSNPDVRAKAASRLGVGKHKKAVPSLVRLLKDENSQVRTAAIKALGSIRQPTSAEPLALALINLSKTVKSRIQGSDREAESSEYEALAEALACIGPTAANCLLKALESESKEARRWAAHTLGLIKDPQAVEPLIQRLEDHRSEVRQTAALALGAIGDARAIAALIRAAANRDMETRRASTEALGFIGSENAVDALTKAVGDQSEPVQLAAIKSLAKIGGLRAAVCLRSAMIGPRKTVSDAAEAALKSMQFSPANAEERAELAVILDDFGAARSEGAIAIPALIKALGFKDPRMRAKAAEGLGLLKSTESVPPLLQAFRDSSAAVQEAAVNALTNIGAPALKDLEASLAFYDASVVRMAASVLGKIGDPHCAPALAGLIVENRKISNEYPEILDAVQSAVDALSGILTSSSGKMSRQDLDRIAELPEEACLMGSQPLKKVDCTNPRNQAREELRRRDTLSIR